MNNLTEFIKFRKICLENVGTALRAAKELQNKQANHIAFHLCTLALEEIGKVIICWFNYCRSQEDGKEKGMLAIDDHIKKIFWAVWWPSFGSELLTTAQMNENKSFASHIHQRRLESLYTELSDTVPADQKISDKELTSILTMVDARLQMAIADEMVEKELSNEMKSFMTYTNDPDRRAFIFGEEAQLKLIETGDAIEWVKWLIEKFEKEEKEMSDLLQAELSRDVDFEATEATTPKWEIKIKLISAIHSIRQNILTEFNEKFPMFKLNKGADNKTLLVSITLDKHVTALALWHYGFIVSRIYVTALNIASNGVFWWHTNVDLDKYYESIIDLESKKKIEATLITKLHWPESTQLLTFDNLVLTMLMNNYIIKCYNKPDFAPFHSYMHVMALMAKNDVHLRFERDLFGILFTTFKNTIIKHQNVQEDQSYQEVGYLQIQGMFNNREYYNQILDIGEKLMNDPNSRSKPITLTEVLAIKQYLGIFLLTLAVRDKHKDNSLMLTNMADTEADDKI